MTRFADQLFDDLMREHGSTLAQARPPAAPKRHVTARRTLLAAGAGGAVAAAVAGTLVAGSGAPAYAVTKNPDGTVTLAVYKTSGIAGANARLRQLGEGQVVIVPVEPGCPTPGSLPAPPVQPRFITIMQSSNSRHGGSVILKVQGIPAGDILVLGAETTTNGPQVSALTGSALTSPPAPACMSLPPAPPAPPSGGSGPGPRPTSSRP